MPNGSVKAARVASVPAAAWYCSRASTGTIGAGVVTATRNVVGIPSSGENAESHVGTPVASTTGSQEIPGTVNKAVAGAGACNCKPAKLNWVPPSVPMVIPHWSALLETSSSWKPAPAITAAAAPCSGESGAAALLVDGGAGANEALIGLMVRTGGVVARHLTRATTPGSHSRPPRAAQAAAYAAGKGEPGPAAATAA